MYFLHKGLGSLVWPPVHARFFISVPGIFSNEGEKGGFVGCILSCYSFMLYFKDDLGNFEGNSDYIQLSYFLLTPKARGVIISPSSVGS